MILICLLKPVSSDTGYLVFVIIHVDDWLRIFGQNPTHWHLVMAVVARDVAITVGGGMCLCECANQQ